MRALILAAGRGSRMRHLTQATAKPLLKVWGEPMVVHQIRALAKAGFRHIVINTAHHSAQFPQVLADGAKWGVEITYSVEGPDFSHALETRGGIVRALPLLSPDGKTPFVVVSGDIVCAYPYERLRQRVRTLDAAHLVLVPQMPGTKGDMAIEAGLAKPRQGVYTYGNIGLFSPAIFQGLKAEHAKLFPWLYQFANAGRVSAELYEGPWINASTPEDLQRLEMCGRQMLEEGLT